MNLFLAPHNDDESLFGAFTLIRERPLVVIVTDSWVQFQRGDGITADQRWAETLQAMRILGCSALRLALPDDRLSPDMVDHALARFGAFDTVYAPAIQGGHLHHDLVGLSALRQFPGRVVQYCTYSESSRSYANVGAYEVIPTREEIGRKRRALGCYTSQFYRSRHHFEAVDGRSEWLTVACDDEYQPKRDSRPGAL